nr:uncharacterized protein c25h2.10c [Quercus suber]
MLREGNSKDVTKYTWQIADRSPQTKKQWRVPRKSGDHNNTGQPQAKVIEPGDSGIWATCNKGKEGKCIGELRDLFAEYADETYAEELASGAATTTSKDDEGDDADAPLDIESEIKAEVDDLHRPRTKQLFTPVRIDVQCGGPRSAGAILPPGEFYCKKGKVVGCPFAVPTSACDWKAARMRASRQQETTNNDDLRVQFAIRPTLRNHNVLTRDSVIKQVASIVGPGHAVDLKNYDLLIVVEVYQVRNGKHRCKWKSADFENR